MWKKTKDFETLLVRLEGMLAPEFLVFLRDLADHREEFLATEFLVDQLVELEIDLTVALVEDIDKRCRKLGIDEKRRAYLRELVDPARPKGIAFVPPASMCSLEDLMAADDPAAFGKANGAGELLIVRALREKFEISFDEAMDRLRAANADTATN